MNPMWDAAQALLALAEECLGTDCHNYARRMVDTARPVADCSSLTVQIDSARSFSGSCVGRGQLSGNLLVHLIRCCDPAPTLTSEGGYVPPKPEDIEAAAACLVKDAWAVLNCVTCQCGTLGAVQGVTACCDSETGPPEVRWTEPSGLCRSATIVVPMIFESCCDTL